MKWLRKKLKDSFFIVNKIYVFIIFIILTILDASIGFIYFLSYIFIYVNKILKSKLPFSINKSFKKETYIYKKTKDNELKLDIWYPDNHDETTPLIYFAHGGGWISGFRNQPNNISWCNFLADKGFITVSIDYRYGFKNSMLDILSDYIDGLNFLKNNSKKLNLNKNNISLVGLSAGGHLALLFSAYFSSIASSDNLKGIRSVVAYYPPTNLKDLLNNKNKSLFAKFGINQTLKNESSIKKDLYSYYSPIDYLTINMIPTLIAHGEEDDVVPFESSINFVKKMDQLNIKYDFLIHKTAGHSFDTNLKDFTTITILEKTVKFLKTYAKGGNNEDNSYFKSEK